MQANGSGWFTRRRLLIMGGTTAALAVVRGVEADPVTALASEGETAPTVLVPTATENGAKVPIVVAMDHPMEPAHHVTSIHVVNERDPIPSKGVFHFTAGNGHAYLIFQARLDEGENTVRVLGGCNRGGQWSGGGSVRVATGGGGCTGAAPVRSLGDIHPPVIRIPQVLRGRPVEPGQVIDVQVKIKHPVRTGLGLRGGQYAQVSEPFYLTSIDVFYGPDRVSRFLLTPALSDDPFITFRLRPREEGVLRVVARDSRGAELEGAHPIRFG
jgi:desulfoferrodoxin (superoxide reductase-like protein)